MDLCLRMEIVCDQSQKQFDTAYMTAMLNSTQDNWRSQRFDYIFTRMNIEKRLTGTWLCDLCCYLWKPFVPYYHKKELFWIDWKLWLLFSSRLIDSLKFIRMFQRQLQCWKMVFISIYKRISLWDFPLRCE